MKVLKALVAPVGAKYTWTLLKISPWLAGCALLSGMAFAEPQSPESRIDKLLSQMSLEQKIGQMMQGEIKTITPKEVSRFGIGSVLNGGGSFPSKNKGASIDDWIDLAEAYYQSSPTLADGTRIPAIWGTDAVHGHNNVMGATLFPHNIGLGAAGSSDLVEAISRATAIEVKATGIDWVFAPTVAVAKDFRWGRTYESYSSDPQLVSRLGVAAVKGFEAEGIVATAKHFIGDGATQRGRDQGDVRSDLETLLEGHGAGYVSTIKAGVPTIMASFNSWNGRKVHGSRQLLTEVLRDQLGFGGMVVSDWNGVGQVAGCNNASCAQAVNAGIDMLMTPTDWRLLQRRVVSQVESGEIPMARIDEAVRRVLAVKANYGILDQGSPRDRVTQELKAKVGSEEHRALARKAVRESLVLLKNNGGILPIKGNAKVVIAGTGADDLSMQSGGWTLTWQGTENSNSDFPGATSIYTGFNDALAAMGGEAILAADTSQDADVALVVFGETPYAEGQGDIENLQYKPDDHVDLELMRAFKAKDIPVVAVFITGRPLWMNRELNVADAFVVAWLPGSEGAGLADVLVGNVQGLPRHDFVGRLPFAWPALDVNEIDDSLPVDRFVWPVGYGLTYAEPATVGSLDEKAAGSILSADAVIFRGGTQSPWANYIGDESNWMTPVSGSYGKSAFGEFEVKSVDVRLQEDARQLTWSGAGERDTQFYWMTANGRGRDFSELREKNGALTMVVMMTEHPEGTTYLRMDCQWPCSGQVDVTRLFKVLPLNQWVRLSFPLACFAEAGTEMDRVNTPFLLVTNHRMSMTVLDVAVVETPDQDSLVKCR
ncbi:glycoside hydrolase family 3 protein [Kineobactrum sediminis]|nr:glycoside hydrolase family 3 protein [Kineobactrum sediminis]